MEVKDVEVWDAGSLGNLEVWNLGVQDLGGSFVGL